MIKTILAAAAISLAYQVVDAAEPWTDTQVAAGATLGALLATDYLQTRQIAKQPELYHEVNPVLGQHPSIGKVNLYFATSAVLGYAVLDTLPSDYRDWALAAGLVLELAVTTHNQSIGLKVKW